MGAKSNTASSSKPKFVGEVMQLVKRPLPAATSRARSQGGGSAGNARGCIWQPVEKSAQKRQVGVRCRHTQSRGVQGIVG